MRVSVRPGDIVVAVSGADDPEVRSVMRRGPAWGITTMWIGSGERPRDGVADHVLWLDDPDPECRQQVGLCCSTTCCGS